MLAMPARCSDRSPDGSEGWLNWIVVDAISDQPAGYLQVTIRSDDGHDQAELAWVIGTAVAGSRIRHRGGAGRRRLARSAGRSPL